MLNEQIDDEGPTEEEFKHMLQQAVLKHYPNPERVGCLHSTTLHDIAQQRLPNEDARWGHISHCSPCYREFLDNRERFLQNQNSRERRTRKVIWMTAVVGLGLLVTAILILRSF